MSARLVSLWGYGLVIAAAVVLQVIARLRPTLVPSFAAALRRAMRHRSAALGLVLAWWWLGWHFMTGA